MLTAHSAKGLEWRIVAVPHLVDRTFPNERKTSSWLKTVTELPAALRGDAQDLPQLALRGGEDRKQVEEALAEHEEGFRRRHAEEERRLCYVALTRSEHCLVVSGYRWGDANATEPKAPSPFLTEVAERVREDPTVGVVEHWCSEPGENPLAGVSRETEWPVDPLGARRPRWASPTGPGGTGGTESEPTPTDEEITEEDDLTTGEDTDVLLAERARTAGRKLPLGCP